MRAVALLPVLLALGACNTTGSGEPAMSQDAIKAAVMGERRSFKDPDSIRDTSIGLVFACHDGTSCVCLETNARNSYGGLTGLQRRIYVFRGQTLEHAREPDRIRGGGERCDTLAPWPDFDSKRRS